MFGKLSWQVTVCLAAVKILQHFILIQQKKAAA
jgi:hypothetical protein